MTAVGISHFQDVLKVAAHCSREMIPTHQPLNLYGRSFSRRILKTAAGSLLELALCLKGAGIVFERLSILSGPEVRICLIEEFSWCKHYV